VLRSDEQLACRYRKTFGAAPRASDDELVLVDVGKALAAFMETLDSPPTPSTIPQCAGARRARRAWRYSEAAAARTQDLHRQGRLRPLHSGPNFSRRRIPLERVSPRWAAH